jgi:hypothetical protein
MERFQSARRPRGNFSDDQADNLLTGQLTEEQLD